MIGGAGYVGGELARILLDHPAVDGLTVTSRSAAGRPLADVHPFLAGSTEAAFSATPPGEAAREADLVFLALEHGAAAAVMDAVLAADPGLVVDLSADFRVGDARLRGRFYGEHPAPALIPRFRYALADVEGDALRGARALAAPGCFATAAALALWPLARSGADLLAPPALFAVTGSSGGGSAPRAAAHHPSRAGNLFAYGVFGHRHEAEILERWRLWTGSANGDSPRLMVHAGPFVRGIHLTAHVRLAGDDAAGIRDAWAEAYAGRPFVRVRDEPVQMGWAVGTNLAWIHPAASPDGRELQVSVAIDNLIKGAAGQAVQAANLALGLDERAGLARAGAGPW